jgi:hypothetical protein
MSGKMRMADAVHSVTAHALREYAASHANEVPAPAPLSKAAPAKNRRFTDEQLMALVRSKLPALTNLT